MPRVCGNPYVKRDPCPPKPACPTACPPPPCSSGRVLSAGLPYIKRPWFTSWYSYDRPYYVRPVYTSQDSSGSVAALVVVAAALAIAVAVSISRDCRLVETVCSAPNLFGEKVCQDIWDCKW